MIGTLFVNEDPYPIRHIYLRDGKIMFEVVLPGPLDLPRDSEVRVHDPEGNVVATAPWSMSKRDAKAAASAHGGWVTIIFPLHIAEVTGWPP